MRRAHGLGKTHSITWTRNFLKRTQLPRKIFLNPSHTVHMAAVRVKPEVEPSRESDLKTASLDGFTLLLFGSRLVETGGMWPLAVSLADTVCGSQVQLSWTLREGPPFSQIRSFHAIKLLSNFTMGPATK
jgi:hypothetical protein